MITTLLTALNSLMTLTVLVIGLIVCVLGAAAASKISAGLNASGTPLLNVSEHDLLCAEPPGPIIRGQQRGYRLCEWGGATSDVAIALGVDGALLGLMLVPDLPLRLRQALVITVFVSLLYIVWQFAIAAKHHHQSLRQEQVIADDFRRRAKPFDTF